MADIAQWIISGAALIAAVLALCGYFTKVYKWVQHQSEQDAEIAQSKEERTLVIYALSACLDGLLQLGANHTVPKAKDKLDKFINQQAHR